MTRGWSVNLSDKTRDFEAELPVPPLFETSVGPVVELVFWSTLVTRWIHAVSEHFSRRLPPGHIQVTVGDLAWLRTAIAHKGPQALRECVCDLERCMVPSDES